MDGVEGVEDHGDSAVGDGLGGKDVDVGYIAGVGLEEEGSGMYTLPLWDLLVEVDDIGVLGVVEYFEQAW